MEGENSNLALYFPLKALAFEVPLPNSFPVTSQSLLIAAARGDGKEGIHEIKVPQKLYVVR